jgi:aminodeoxyfutalosine deaminase
MTALLLPRAGSRPSWLRALPKAELHLHLEGTVSPETLVELSQRHDDDRLTLAEARSLYRYTDFTGFLLAFKAVSERLRTAADYELITYRMLERLAAQGVVHAEAYVSVGVVYYWRRIEFEALFYGMEAARVRAERQFGITLYWIFDAVRHFGPEEAARVFRKAAELRRSRPASWALGLAATSAVAGAEPFRELFQEAQDAGLRLTAHAGETMGPESIWAALNIGAERIGHALSAQLDPDLMEVLAERQVPLEICVTSNLRTGCCPTLEEHPGTPLF